MSKEKGWADMSAVGLTAGFHTLTLDGSRRGPSTKDDCAAGNDENRVIYQMRREKTGQRLPARPIEECTDLFLVGGTSSYLDHNH